MVQDTHTIGVVVDIEAVHPSFLLRILVGLLIDSCKMVSKIRVEQILKA